MQLDKGCSITKHERLHFSTYPTLRSVLLIKLLGDLMKTKFQIILGVMLLVSAKPFAASSVLSYPAHLCQQVSGPADSLIINESGNVSNSNPDQAISLNCPVQISSGDIDKLEIHIQVHDKNEASNRIKCQVGQTRVGGSLSGGAMFGAWGNTATSEVAEQIQTLITKTSTDTNTKNVTHRAFLSCVLPANHNEGASSLLSYQVTQRFHRLD